MKGYAANLKSFCERETKIRKGTVIYAGDLKRSGSPAAVNFKETANVILRDAAQEHSSA